MRINIVSRCELLRVSLIFPNVFSAFPATRTHQPLSLAYLAASLRSARVEVQVIDATAERLSNLVVARKLLAFNPDYIGITTNIGIMRRSLSLSKFIKQQFPRVKVIMGGPWATIESNFLLKRGLADIVVHGEGERTMVELVGALSTGTSLHDVKGISFVRADGAITTTPVQPFIGNLDELPFPAWDLFPPSKKYQFLHRSQPFFPVMTSRGCPFDCIHCTKVVHGYKFRARSVENVVSELRYLKDNFNAKEIFIIDDNFNHDLDRAEKILDGIIREKFNFRIKFTNGIRADKLPERFVKKLKLAGTYAVNLGIESGNQEIVRKIGKGLDLKKVVESVRLLKRYGFIVGGFFMLGHPYDTAATMQQTISFARALDLDFPFFFKAVPFPGTKMYELVSKSGTFLIHVDKNPSVETYNLKSPTYEIWNLHAKDVENTFSRAYKSFYLRPRKILSLLSQFRSITEFTWVINTVLKTIVKNA